MTNEEETLTGGSKVAANRSIKDERGKEWQRGRGGTRDQPANGKIRNVIFGEAEG